MALWVTANIIPRVAAPASGAPTRGAESERALPPLPARRRKIDGAATRGVRCGAAPASSSSVADYDLYDLLGIESSSDQSQIKNAYRALQKHCHPDVAGPSGHHMAIVLNEAYALLSDPTSRSAYDKERARRADFLDYTGRPLYSAWFGAESEQRAVFVDEVRCVGCLKCALFAGNTFAIEAAYGRARVVGQWADPEHKIHQAIQTCPVDCISIVARSDLAALEYLMSKQPRGHVRMTGSTGGAAGSNIFADVDKFKRRYGEMTRKASTERHKESEIQREARASAMQGIRSITYWWYRLSHSAARSKPEARRALALLVGGAIKDPGTERLREAAAKRRAGEASHSAGRGPPPSRSFGDEYWKPSRLLPPTRKLPAPGTTPTSFPVVGEENGGTTRRDIPAGETAALWPSPAAAWIPPSVAALAAAVVGSSGGRKVNGGLEEHVGGGIALDVVNSFWLQILLAGITWFLAAAAVIGLVELLGRRWSGRRRRLRESGRAGDR